MATRSKTTFAKAQAGLSRALRDFEKTVIGLVSSPPAKKPRKAKIAKTRKKAAKK
jgi:hypothetical protein